MTVDVLRLAGLVSSRAWFAVHCGGHMVIDLVSAPQPMFDDRHAQFLCVVADACSGAELAELIVEVLTSDDTRYSGVPTAVGQPDAPDGATLRIGGSVIALAEVVELLVRPPRERSGLHRRGTTTETQSTVAVRSRPAS